MRTLLRTSLVVSMALAFLCLTVPLGYTQEGTAPKTLCAKCGVANTYPKCPPGVLKEGKPYCPDAKDVIRPNWSFNFRSGAVDVSPSEDSNLAFGFCPAWSNDGTCLYSPKTACPKCGAGFPTSSRLKRLENQP
jgi:hypothetical protein